MKLIVSYISLNRHFSIDIMREMLHAIRSIYFRLFQENMKVSKIQKNIMKCGQLDLCRALQIRTLRVVHCVAAYTTPDLTAQRPILPSKTKI